MGHRNRVFSAGLILEEFDIANFIADNIAMKTADIAELKNSLSEFVAAVEKGEEIRKSREILDDPYNNFCVSVILVVGNWPARLIGGVSHWIVIGKPSSEISLKRMVGSVSQLIWKFWTRLTAFHSHFMLTQPIGLSSPQPAQDVFP